MAQQGQAPQIKVRRRRRFVLVKGRYPRVATVPAPRCICVDNRNVLREARAIDGKFLATSKLRVGPRDRAVPVATRRVQPAACDSVSGQWADVSYGAPMPRSVLVNISSVYMI